MVKVKSQSVVGHRDGAVCGGKPEEVGAGQTERASKMCQASLLPHSMSELEVFFKTTHSPPAPEAEESTTAQRGCPLGWGHTASETTVVYGHHVDHYRVSFHCPHPHFPVVTLAS